MGRKRIISADQILDATERVVARNGAAQLTLDAVAAQASISKATILYCYRSKDELIDAVVRRGVAQDTAVNDAATASLGDVPNAVIHGRVLAAAEAFPVELRAVALSLCSALAQDAELRSVMQDTQTAVIERIKTTSANPRGAMLAYLALEGLKLLETLDWHTWPKHEREDLLQEISWLAETETHPPKTRRASLPSKVGRPKPSGKPETKRNTSPKPKASAKSSPKPKKLLLGTTDSQAKSKPIARRAHKQSVPEENNS